MAGSEAAIEREVCRRAERELGLRNLKLTVIETGWPDRMFLIPGGLPVFIEFKRPGGTVSPRQRYIHGILRQLGYVVEVFDEVVAALVWLKEKCEKS